MEQPPSVSARSVADLHHDCFACGRGEDGLGLTFEPSGADTVSAEWFCDELYQSYPGILHGGIVATILDCAMTNCLLMRGISALTADIHVRYHAPVRVGRMTAVRATLVRSRYPLYVLDAVVMQDGRVSASASAKFMCADIVPDANHV